MSSSNRDRRRFNLNRRIRRDCDPEELARLIGSVKYGGNPEHKRNPGDFQLNPPAQPRADKTLCDAVGIFDKSKALQLLREGVRRGLISEQTRGGFPQNVWSVTEEGEPLEAQLENQAQGIYHGYPMPKNDDFRDEVLNCWKDE
ncbi:MAG: hypothetical protein OXP10_01395 [Chloroflexota bacterium]|nr:hypothetical protein [Chloroflexota bacterium]MDE2940989.1 hypothetical protein [Chloroflexota bacterium]